MTDTKSDSLFLRLERAFLDIDDVLVPKGMDPNVYIADLIDDIRRHRCEPCELSAVVTEPGFPDMQLGETVAGTCVARNSGYWLVYDSKKDRFYAFWGEDPMSLGAPGVYGSPLYCWSA